VLAWDAAFGQIMFLKGTKRGSVTKLRAPPRGNQSFERQSMAKEIAERRPAAIFAADVLGYLRSVMANEDHTLAGLPE
jgi:hypothetical protein